MIEIKELAQVPDYVPICAFWSYKQWYRSRSIDFDIVLKAYTMRAGGDSIPLTYVVTLDTLPVGMVSLKRDDLWTRRDLNPWLASLYVIPECRRMGIGVLLVKKVVEKARSMELDRIHLFIGSNESIDLEAYYTNLGWKFLEEAVDNDGKPTRIYYFQLR